MADEQLLLTVASCPAPSPEDASKWDAEVASGMAMDAEVMEYMPTSVTSGMMLVPYDQPIYGPHLPGLEAGNVHNNSPVPASFMVGDGDGSQKTDVRDDKAARGVCGLRNMGNTCFMNSGLQCLMHNGHLVQQLPQAEQLLPETLSRRFRSLADKAWSGKYSLLHPGEFKETMGFMHGQFRDHRQHDGQEFLALLLDTLHEELNQAKSKKKTHSPFEDISENSSDSQYMSEASTSKLSELEALEIDSGKEEHVPGNQNNRRGSEKETSSGSEESGAGEDVKVPSIEEFFKKDMKTLNTNMMQGEEVTSNVATGSEKFPKAENSKKLQKSPTKQQRSPLRNRVENDCEKLNSPPKNKKTNLLVAKKNLKGNLKNGSGEGVGVKFVTEKDVHEDEDPIKRMKMDSCSKTELLQNLAKEGLTTSFHNYATYAVPELLSKDGFFPITDSKVTNKLIELEGMDTTLKPVTDEACFNQLKPQIGLHDPSVKRPNLLYPTKNEETQSNNSAKQGDEKQCLAPHTSTSEEQDCCFIPNNQQFLTVQRTPSRIKKETVMEDVDLGGDEGEGEWEDYIRANQSPIVDFQGQFKSTVVCAVCGHISIIYEPFMYLSVPLPRAMEKQLVITFIPKHGQMPGRYLVTLNRLDTVKELRRAVIGAVYGDGLPEDKELVLAEGFDHHISRFLEDSIQLRYVNDSFRLLYALEAYSKSVLEEPVHITITPNEAVPIHLTQESDSGTGNDDVTFESIDMQKQASLDLNERIESEYPPTSAERAFEAPEASWDDVLTSNQYVEMNNVSNSKVTDLESQNCASDTGIASDQDVFSNMTYFDANDLPPMDTQNDDALIPPRKTRGSNSSLQGNVDINSPEAVWGPIQDEGATWNDDVFIPEKGGETSDSGVVMSPWHSCAICLEEYPEHQLLTHKACGGVLCHACMERAVKHYGQQAVDCPVCRKEIDPSQDYVLMQMSQTARPAKRVLLLPVLFRNDAMVDGETKGELFAYPNAVHTYNEVGGECLYSEIESMLPVHTPFTIVLTDGRGVQCSRCIYSVHCRGCQLVREVDITLHSDDHLTVVYQNLPAEVMESASRAYDDRSFRELASNNPLTLRDCFKAFTESEDLDEHNPWFCPKCCEPQCARKTIAVCRYPDTLIVYLKRFVFHQFTSTKLENKVQFPVEGLDMSNFLCPGVSSEGLDLIYDLQSCVCHLGGVNSGHYTCYVRNSLSNQWQYCNDENIVTQQAPADSDSASVYILFYQRRGLNVEFTPPVGYDLATSGPPPPPPSSPPPGQAEGTSDLADRKSLQSGIDRFISELNREEERVDDESRPAGKSTDLD